MQMQITESIGHTESNQRWQVQILEKDSCGLTPYLTYSLHPKEEYIQQYYGKSNEKLQ